MVLPLVVLPAASTSTLGWLTEAAAVSSSFSSSPSVTAVSVCLDNVLMMQAMLSERAAKYYNTVQVLLNTIKCSCNDAVNGNIEYVKA